MTFHNLTHVRTLRTLSEDASVAPRGPCALLELSTVLPLVAVQLTPPSSPPPQWDIEWRLLSLLVNLSHNPTSVASRPRPAPGQPPLAALPESGEERWQEQEQEPDWRQELRLPEPEYSPYQSPVRRC